MVVRLEGDEETEHLWSDPAAGAEVIHEDEVIEVGETVEGRTACGLSGPLTLVAAPADLAARDAERLCADCLGREAK